MLIRQLRQCTHCLSTLTNRLELRAVVGSADQDQIDTHDGHREGRVVVENGGICRTATQLAHVRNKFE